MPDHDRNRNDARRRGVILILFLLAIILLATLVLWVANLGQQVSHRITTQHTADNTVRSGAGWVSRSLNTVAYNNIAISRALAMVNVLDAMPQAVTFTRMEHEKFAESLANQTPINDSPGRLYDTLNQLLDGFAFEVDQELADLIPVEQFFLDLDVGQMTEFQRDGLLWQSMYAMDEMNQAVAERLAPMASYAAVEGGRTNVPSADAAMLMAPADPEIPFRRGQFMDFELPVRIGILPAHADHYELNRGPFDTIFGWRDIHYQCTGGTYVPGSRSGGANASGRGINITRGAGGGNGRWVGRNCTPDAYMTYGPQTWMRREIGNYNSAHLRNTRLSSYHGRITDVKTGFIWPNDINLAFQRRDGDPTTHSEVDYGDINRQYNLPSVQTRNIRVPDWRISYAEAQQIARAGTPRIYETAFFVVEIKSKYPMNHGAFLTDGTWTTVDEDGLWSPRIAFVSGWRDPARWRNIDHVGARDAWRDEWQYTVEFDHSIGIPGERDASGNWIPQPVYRIDHVIFAGVNVGEPATITNPYQGFNPLDIAAPAPMDFDHEAMPSDDEQLKWEHLNMLAVARRADVPQVWPSRFRGGRPFPHMVALAQARVFNNHSWDLWTPMWRAELTPIVNRDGRPGIDDWIRQLDRGTPEGVSASDVVALREYLDASKSLAQSMVGH